MAALDGCGLFVERQTDKLAALDIGGSHCRNDHPLRSPTDVLFWHTVVNSALDLSQSDARGEAALRVTNAVHYAVCWRDIRRSVMAAGRRFYAALNPYRSSQLRLQQQLRPTSGTSAHSAFPQYVRRP